ncbi:unnamed protein product [Polarella glacialis]|uniref:Uncharacterized protein n=1 Tax=Polarella glacialis TaxID=89957 RepID=A0A813KUX6_POLGL|nr:unnamed protein product [Polarella glacialis]
MEDLVGSDEERLRQEFSRPKVEEGTYEGEDKVEDTLSEVLTGQPTPPAAPAELYTSCLQRPGLEPLTVLPGRYRAVAKDVAVVLQEFTHQLGVAESAKVSPIGGATLQLPRLGAFPMFRGIFKERGLSVMVEGDPGELARDVFQLVCGVCWMALMEAKSLVSQVAAVFLVYLLFKSQHPGCYAIPVNVEVLEQLMHVRGECYEKQVLLECPRILRVLSSGAFSIGIRATCRNLFFDRCGQLAERTSPEFVPGSKASSRLSSGATRVSDGVPVLREAPPDLGRAEQDAVAYEVQLAQVEAAGPHGRPVLPLASLGKPLQSELKFLKQASSSYVQDTPPEPRDIVCSGAQLVQSSEEVNREKDESPVVSRRKRRRPAFDEDESPKRQGPDPALERCLVQAKETGQEDVVVKSKFRTPVSRQSRLTGLDQAVAKGAALRSLGLPPPVADARAGPALGERLVARATAVDVPSVQTHEAQMQPRGRKKPDLQEEAPQQQQALQEEAPQQQEEEVCQPRTVEEMVDKVLTDFQDTEALPGMEAEGSESDSGEDEDNDIEMADA